MKNKIIISFLFLLILNIGCKTNSATTESTTQTKVEKQENTIPNREHSIQALLWQQQSSEYKALSHQAFNLAKMYLDKLTTNKLHKRPLAIVTDIDETVLDNSPYNARMVRDNSNYTRKTWKAWGEEEKARSIPGALEFFKYAQSKGVTIFYISNRRHDQKEETMKNLIKNGFPAVDAKHVLLRTDTGKKQARRDIVSKTHKIVMLLGDNLSDFSELFDGKSTKERNNLVKEMKNDFGTKFIVLPNPMYGDWETKGIYEASYKWTEKQKDSIRKAKLIVD